MLAPLSSTELLEVADLLVNQDDAARPQPTCLRRAVSSAYYALFHELVGDSVHRVAGTGPATQAQRNAVSRWYSHSVVRAASEWVVRRSAGRKLPDLVVPLLASCPANLVAVAKAFLLLYEERNEADYNPAATLSRPAVEACIAKAREAIAHLPRLRGEPGYHGYLLLLLGGPRIAIR